MNRGEELLPALVAFDLDDTLAPSKSPIEQPIAMLFAELLERTEVAVISGGQFGQFRSQLIEPLRALEAQLSNLHIMPACGTQYYRISESEWERQYLEALTPEEKKRTFEAIEKTAHRLGLWADVTWGARLEDRESQVTFSALGQEAPLEVKAMWDPTGIKKRRLRDAVAPLVPDLEVRVGGSTSIDVTRRGRDKAFGMRRLLEITSMGLDDVLFFGDQLEEGGNDYPVRALGVQCIAVKDWPETRDLLERLLADADIRSVGRKSQNKRWPATREVPQPLLAIVSSDS